MKKLGIKNIKNLLQDLKTDPVNCEIILSAVQQFNSLVEKINSGDEHNQYLAYQIRINIFQMIKDLKKTNIKEKELKDNDEDYPFNQFLKKIEDLKNRPFENR